MSWYLAVPSVLLALLFAAGGVAAVRTGWVLPWQRRHVHRVRLFGWAQLVIAAAFAAKVATGLFDDPGADAGLGSVSLLVLLGGFGLMVVSQRPESNS
ncbi:hypothetical protein AB0G79_29775 [Streptomyces sp. NPDC020807]|uniref:hypothetical protein n=1 Tax=Streptomyces sp. NPDC020807 TaxID=3155119 RepID=UPI0033CB6284